MSPIVKAGVTLGLGAELWTFIVLALGWHNNPTTLLLFYLVILYQGGILFWGLRLSAKQGRTYGKQVATGLFISGIGSVFIFIGSFILTSYIFPAYFIELEEGLRAALVSRGLSEAEIQIQLDVVAGSHTPLMNAINGVIGTMSAGLIFSLIISAFVKSTSMSEPVHTDNSTAE
jgi:hypothetical protein